MKKIALLVSLLALLLSISAFAQDGDGNVLFFAEETVVEKDSFAASGDYYGISQEVADELIEYLYVHVKNAELSIDVSRFKIPYSNFDDTRTAWLEMVKTHRDVEYYASTFTPGGSSDSSGKYVGKLNINSYRAWNDFGDGAHNISTSEILSTNAAVDEKIEEIVSQIPAETSNLEKILFVHDWLCVNGEYDYARLNDGTMPRTSYDIRGILLYEIGVCQSYTWTFDYIMEWFDIPCINVTSRSMGHTWNQVQVEGCWYNMDVTWDDPTQDMLGRTRHAYFLCSDDHFKAGDSSNSMNPHFGYSDGVDCSSTKYDDAFWVDVNTPMPYINGEVFYLKQSDGKIRATDIDNPSATSRVVRSVTHNWRYSKYYLNLIGYKGSLYFNEGDAIARIQPDGSGYRVLKSFSTSDSSCVYGIRLKGDKIEYAYVETLNVLVPANGSIEIVPAVIPITSIKLPFEYAKMRCSKWTMIDVVVNSGADTSRLIWTSSDPAVATVSKDGRVDTLKCGVTTITATSPDNSSVKATMVLTVYVDITSISFIDSPSSILNGSSVTLKVKLNDGALASDVVWTSSDSRVLTVDTSGTVTAKGYGTAMVIAKSSADSSVYASVALTVYEKVKTISLARNSTTMYKGTSVTLKLDLNEGARREDVTWAVSGSSAGIVSVDANGTVNLKGVGTAIISVWSKEDPSICTSIKVTIEDAMPGDPNGDGKVDTRDAVVLAQYLAGWDISYDMSIADINHDGKVDTRDAVRLAQYLAGWDVTLG